MPGPARDSRRARCAVLTDVDGCVLGRGGALDARTASLLRKLDAAGAAVCFVTSKTRVEVEDLARRIGRSFPAVVEAGGGHLHSEANV